jgi:hypothetical protein
MRTLHKTRLEQPAPTEEEVLQASGFTFDEVVSLMYLRTWYQTGGSDRAPIMRHWEFIRLLVQSGRMEV